MKRVRAVRAGSSSRLCGCSPYRLLLVSLAAGASLYVFFIFSLFFSGGNGGAAAAASSGDGDAGTRTLAMAGGFVRASPAPVVKASPRASSACGAALALGGRRLRSAASCRQARAGFTRMPRPPAARRSAVPLVPRRRGESAQLRVPARLGGNAQDVSKRGRQLRGATMRASRRCRRRCSVNSLLSPRVFCCRERVTRRRPRPYPCPCLPRRPQRPRQVHLRERVPAFCGPAVFDGG